FFVTDPPRSEIYTLSLHDALPIFNVGLVVLIVIRDEIHQREAVMRGDEVDGRDGPAPGVQVRRAKQRLPERPCLLLITLEPAPGDRKSTRLNSSHVKISYAVFCLK